MQLEEQLNKLAEGNVIFKNVDVTNSFMKLQMFVSELIVDRTTKLQSKIETIALIQAVFP